MVTLELHGVSLAAAPLRLPRRLTRAVAREAVVGEDLRLGGERCSGAVPGGRDGGAESTIESDQEKVEDRIVNWNGVS